MRYLYDGMCDVSVIRLSKIVVMHCAHDCQYRYVVVPIQHLVNYVMLVLHYHYHLNVHDHYHSDRRWYEFSLPSYSSRCRSIPPGHRHVIGMSCVALSMESIAYNYRNINRQTYSFHGITNRLLSYRK
jgi:hypothetical protein